MDVGVRSYRAGGLVVPQNRRRKVVTLGIGKFNFAKCRPRRNADAAPQRYKVTFRRMNNNNAHLSNQKAVRI
jgi:hypothetical protein